MILLLSCSVKTPSGEKEGDRDGIGWGSGVVGIKFITAGAVFLRQGKSNRPQRFTFPISCTNRSAKSYIFGNFTHISSVRFHKNRSPSGCHRSNLGKEGKPRSTRKGRELDRLIHVVTPMGAFGVLGRGSTRSDLEA